MRPPSCNDGPVAVPSALRKAQPSTPAATAAAATLLQLSPTTIASVYSASASAAPTVSATAAALGADFSGGSSGRRAFFSRTNDSLLCYTAAEAPTSVATTGHAFQIVSYERRAVDEPSPSQVSFSSNVRRDVDEEDADDDADDDQVHPNQRPATHSDNRHSYATATESSALIAPSDDSSSANNCMLYTTKLRECGANAPPPPTVVADAVRSGPRPPSAEHDLKRKRASEPATTATGEPDARDARVVLVKNSASLVFTTKKPPAVNCQLPLAAPKRGGAAAIGGGGGELGPVVHRRHRDGRPGSVGARAADVEQRRSLHDAQQQQQQQLERRREAQVRSERAYSWYAPLYQPLREEGGDSRMLQTPSPPNQQPQQQQQHHHLQLQQLSASASAASANTHGTSESASLLERLVHHPPQLAATPPATSVQPPSSLMLLAQKPGAGDHLYAKRQFSMSPHGGAEAAGVLAGAQAAAAQAQQAQAQSTAPKYSRFEQLIKSLVGRKVSKPETVAVGSNGQLMTATATGTTASPTTVPPPPASASATAFAHQHQATVTPQSPGYALPSPEIRITKSPSEYSLLRGGADGGGGGGGAGIARAPAHMSSTASLNAAVQQRLWSVVPLLTRRDAGASCASLAQQASGGGGGAGGGGGGGLGQTLMKKCETVLALSRTASSQHLNPSPVIRSASTVTNAGVRPQNRLRNSSSSTITCSRCSSLLSLAANGSRYSLNVSQGGGFVAIGGGGGGGGGSCAEQLEAAEPMVCSRSSLLAAAGPIAQSPGAAEVAAAAAANAEADGGGDGAAAMWSCKLCLTEVPQSKVSIIGQCRCVFCTECMRAYVEFEILEGAYEISCPDALCPEQGALSMAEIGRLSSGSLLDKHQRYRLNREVDLDKMRTWCPKAGCDTVCRLTTVTLADTGADATGTGTGTGGAPTTTRNSVSMNPIHSYVEDSPPRVGGQAAPCLVNCPTCAEQFCSGCKKTWHAPMSCEQNTRRLAADGTSDNIGIPFDSDLIKCCPTCSVPIEKDEGCAQMMCKRCKHVFCWYCLASLDDDFLLRHYDRGPCKNKLGHSRASVVWHRAQVIGIFAGFGILLLVASPLLLLAAPCIVCCKCRICSGAGKLDESGGEADFEEISGLNR